MAHSGNVNCLRFGKKTRRQFLTGGDDQNVNLWSIGKPTADVVSSNIHLFQFICASNFVSLNWDN